MSSRNEVFYTLQAQLDADYSVVEAISTHRLYTDAHADGRELPIGWHMIVKRHSIPNASVLANAQPNKFEWHVDDVEIERES